MAVVKQSNKTSKPLKLDKKLVINQWMLEIFEVPIFEKPHHSW